MKSLNVFYSRNCIMLAGKGASFLVDNSLFINKWALCIVKERAATDIALIGTPIMWDAVNNNLLETAKRPEAPALQ